MKLRAGGHVFDFSSRTFIMGILNVTPDSFSDGGLHMDPSAAVEHALEMAALGADIIDIGGESTRPGSTPVDEQLEIRRTEPVIRALRKRSSVAVSIDTCKAAVARAALEAGADIINDISAMRSDAAMPRLAARYRTPVVLMHMKGTPGDMQKNPVYGALIPEILDYLGQAIRLCTEAGVERDKIIIDPGIGFGKTTQHNLQILKSLRAFAVLGLPILSGPSRKAFIGNVSGGLPSGERLAGTLAAVTASILNGADIVRVHDVKEAVRAARVADAIKRAPEYSA